MIKAERAEKIKANIISKLENTSSKSFLIRMILITALTYLCAVAITTLMDLILYNFIHGEVTILGILGYFLSTTVINFVPITIIAGILITILTFPIVRIMKRRENGETITEDKFFAARKRTNRIPEAVFLMNILFPIILNFISALFIEKSGIDHFIVLLRNISVFILAGLVQNALYQRTMMQPRAILKIYSIDKSHSNWFAKHLNRIQMYATILFICAVFLHSAIDIFQQVGERFDIDLISRGSNSESVFSVKENNFDKMRQKMQDAVKAESSGQLENAREMGRNFGHKLLLLMISMGILTIIIIATVDGIVNNAKKTQIRILRDVLSHMSEGSGDLTQRILIVQGDEVGLISEKINKVFDKLQTMFRNITSQANQVAETSGAISAVLEGTVAATEEMAASVNQINYNADRNRKVVSTAQHSLENMLSSLEQINSNVNTQAAYVEQTSSAMTEMIANIQSVNEVTSKANEVSESLSAVSEEGSRAVLNSIAAVKDIEESSIEVNTLVITISKILAQTNMLAMNAAIEAAHAGDAGRGFAVVAEEVRNLADDSSTNLKTISANMRDVLDRVGRGVKLSETAGDALKEVGSKTSQTTRLMNEVASAMQEQAAGANEVLNSIHSLVEASNSINKLSEDQQHNNEIMKENLEQTVNAFTEVQSATSELSLGNTEILNGIDELKQVIMKNDEVVASLQKELGGYKI
ncbi:MAG: hypothetical protein JEZ04_05625 [Spirochaetales bacterium]|nr:hypothetical protein [Spirochaetales bacterium]